jgi:tetratricopeptide (TPR) repeat protein
VPPLGESDIDPALQAAGAFLAAGDTEVALEALAPALASDAPPVASKFLLSMLAWRMGRLDWALDLVRQCHEAAPMDSAIAEALASLLAEAGDLVECIYMAKIATALKGESPLAQFVPADFPSFEAAFRGINERPRLAEAERARAEGRFEDSLECARQHVAIAGGDAEGRAFYARALLEAGRAGDAVDALAPVADEARGAAAESLYARCLAACGAFEAARRAHDRAMRLAPEDAALEAARVADGLWLDPSADLAGRAAAWAARFCPPQKPRALEASDGPLVVAYLVAALADPDDADAITAVARAHDPRRTKVIAYAAGAQSWPSNIGLCGAFDEWRDIGALDGATIARYLAHDRVNVVVDACGFALPKGLLALPRVDRALRLSWLGNPARITAPLFDACIDAYPVPESEARRDPARDGFHFGADIILAQLDDETLALWRAVLAAAPKAKLLLRARDLSRGAIDRLVARFGRESSARIDIVSAARFEDFYARIDLTLLPRRGVSPRVAAQSVACGVPALALAGSIYDAHASAVAADMEDYVRRALAPIAVAPRPADAALVAAAIEEKARQALSLGAAA